MTLSTPSNPPSVTQMRAAIVTGYGTPDKLRIVSRPVPQPKRHQVLIKIHAAAVSAADCAVLHGDPFIVKLIYGLQKPKHEVPGVEFAGQVHAVGDATTSFAVGDRVFGMHPHGAQAEFLCMPENGVLAHLPDQLAYDAGVSLLDGATTAMTFLRQVANVQPGQRVLVNGASGAVGIFGVQIARHLGAHVTGVCSAANAAMVQHAGAGRVIDYTQGKLFGPNDAYDVIFDAVGKLSFSLCKPALAAKGVYLSTVPSMALMGDVLASALLGGKRAKFATAGLMQSRQSIEALAKLAESGALHAVIDRRFSLNDIAHAYAYVETGHKKGSVIISTRDG